MSKTRRLWLAVAVAHLADVWSTAVALGMGGHESNPAAAAALDGGVVGLVSKAYALVDEDTQWSRWASIPNAILYIGTVAAFATLGLWLTATTSAISMLIWFGIGIWRTPDHD